MQTDEAEHIFAQYHRHDEERTRTQTLGQKPHALVVSYGRNVVETNRLANIDVLGKLFEVERNDRSQTGRYVVRRPPLVADAQLTRRPQLDYVAAIDAHHAAEFGNDDSQEAVEIDGVWESHREAVDDSLARLVHFDLAF